MTSATQPRPKTSPKAIYYSAMILLIIVPVSATLIRQESPASPLQHLTSAIASHQLSSRLSMASPAPSKAHMTSVYRDIISEDQLLTDGYPIQLFEDVFLKVETKDILLGDDNQQVLVNNLVKAENLAAAQALAFADPLHTSGSSIVTVYEWNAS